MKTHTHIIKLILMIIILINTDSALAQRNSDTRNRVASSTPIHQKIGSVHTTKHYKRDRYRTQPVHRSPHYRYPRHHRVIRTLPRHHVRLVYRGLPYYYHAGIYYSVYNNGYVVVMPPIGFRISVLPVGYVRVVLGPSVFFYHSGVYYKETTTISSEEGKYEITKPPVGAVIKEIDKDAEEVIIDGKVFYDYNDMLYKKISTYDGNTAYEVVYVNEEE
ncbi:DUF6515 family protein [Aquimarina sp. AU474]|uniref:DUF6515 family protein n=1 Tax=Aquimarina sp. AU474 TaxID=2108529 RepID=UPI001F267D65|nr:DUF6515 family protein [Aquimarina sp. AU474]